MDEPTSNTPVVEVQPETKPPVLAGDQHKSHRGLAVVGVIVTIILVVAGSLGGYYKANTKASKIEADLNAKIARLQDDTHELPAGAIKVSDCVPNMGSHYLPKESDPIYGPFVIVNHQGRVIGLEYMASPDMYVAIPATSPPVEVITRNSPLYGWKFDHTEFSHVPKGHEGFMKDHIDVHSYTVTSAEQKTACS